MKKTTIHCTLSIIMTLIGIIFTLCAIFLNFQPSPRKSSLLIIAIVLILSGIVSFSVNYRKYHLIAGLYAHDLTYITSWDIPTKSSTLFPVLIKEKKTNSILTSFIFFVLSLICCWVFTYSGGTHLLKIGYLLIGFCASLLIISLRFIDCYYTHMQNKPDPVLFGQNYIYFLDELYTLEYDYCTLQKVELCKEEEIYLVLCYGNNDTDEPPTHIVTIPVPPEKMYIATYLKNYYNELLSNLNY